MYAYALIVLGVGLLQPGMPSPAEQKESKRFQGTWQQVSLTVDGRAVPAAEVRATRIRFEGYRWGWVTGDGYLEGIYKLNPSRKPPHIDLTFSIGLDEGKILQGIYKLEGDRLTLCLPHLGAARPKGFTAKRGVDVSVWKRVKR